MQQTAVSVKCETAGASKGPGVQSWISVNPGLKVSPLF